MKKQSGFTLVEIAIVMVIIGLLLGGVMKGQELMVNAKVKNLASDFNVIPAAYYSYVDRFRAVPGDDSTAVTHLGATASQATTGGTIGNGVVEGAWNTVTTTDESMVIFQHLRLANLMNGSTAVAASNAYYQQNAMAGRVGVSSASTITGQTGSLFVCSTNIEGSAALRLDNMLDDGNGTTGGMNESLATGATTAVATPATGTNYTACARM